MHEIRFTPEAKKQLKEIWHYSAETWGESRADKYLADIDRALGNLSRNPGPGRVRPNVKTGYCSINVNKHVVFYMLVDDHICIIGVLHARMDVRDRL